MLSTVEEKPKTSYKWLIWVGIAVVIVVLVATIFKGCNSYPDQNKAKVDSLLSVTKTLDSQVVKLRDSIESFKIDYSSKKQISDSSLKAKEEINKSLSKDVAKYIQKYKELQVNTNDQEDVVYDIDPQGDITIPVSEKLACDSIVKATQAYMIQDTALHNTFIAALNEKDESLNKAVNIIQQEDRLVTQYQGISRAKDTVILSYQQDNKTLNSKYKVQQVKTKVIAGVALVAIITAIVEGFKK